MTIKENVMEVFEMLNNKLVEVSNDCIIAIAIDGETHEANLMMEGLEMNIIKAVAGIYLENEVLKHAMDMVVLAHHVADKLISDKAKEN
jgi:hypothetical protein